MWTDLLTVRISRSPWSWQHFEAEKEQRGEGVTEVTNLSIDPPMHCASSVPPSLYPSIPTCFWCSQLRKWGRCLICTASFFTTRPTNWSAPSRMAFDLVSLPIWIYPSMVKVGFDATFKEETGVCFPCESKRHRASPKPNHMVFVLKLNHENTTHAVISMIR